MRKDSIERITKIRKRAMMFMLTYIIILISMLMCGCTFVVLKLANEIQFSWLWVLSPFWLAFLLFVGATIYYFNLIKKL